MTFIIKFKDYLKKQFTQEKSPQKVALSLSVAIFVAFSPFLLMHTFLTMGLTWLFGLNFAITFAVMHIIHNPWATLAIYASDYMVGDWLLHKICGLDTVALNPSWMGIVNSYITKYIGLSNISLIAFLVGGNVLGLVLAVMLYPIIKMVCTRLMTKPSLS